MLFEGLHFAYLVSLHGSAQVCTIFSLFGEILANSGLEEESSLTLKFNFFFDTFISVVELFLYFLFHVTSSTTYFEINHSLFFFDQVLFFNNINNMNTNTVADPVDNPNLASTTPPPSLPPS